MTREIRQTPCAECAFWTVLLGRGRCENRDVRKKQIRIQVMLERGEMPCHWFERREGKEQCWS